MRHTIEEHLADGSIRVTADDRYYLNPATNLWHRSVTGITGCYPAPQLLPWAVNSFNTYADNIAYLDEVGGQGTQVHEVLEIAKRVTYSSAYSDIWHYLTAARNFFRIFRPRVLRREFVVYGVTDRIRWAGTVDIEMELDEGLLEAYLDNRRVASRKDMGESERTGEYVKTITDYKTSNNLYRKHYLQTAGYLSADSEDFSEHRGLILQLGTKHSVGFFLDQVEPIVDIPVFRHLCHIHKDLVPDDPPSWLVEGELEFEST